MKANYDIINYGKEEIEVKAKLKVLLKKVNFIYIVSISTLVLLRFFFYIFDGFKIFSIGFLFDLMIDFALVIILFFIFKKQKSRKIAIGIFTGIYFIIYLFDYIYHRTFAKLGSASAIKGIIFVNADAYGITIDYQITILLSIFILFIIFIIKYKYEQKSIKRYKPSLLMIGILLVPYIYTTTIYLIPHEDFESYSQSKQIILIEPDLMQSAYINNFGYSIFRYEDFMDSLKNIIVGGNNNESQKSS